MLGNIDKVPVKKIHYVILLSPFITSIILKIIYQILFLTNSSLFSIATLHSYLSIISDIFIMLMQSQLIHEEHDKLKNCI